ncbi:MAG TPA: hypothetical protein VLG91_00805, partial [Streptomyces sp.]|nr:hypothetical protein [Streptomyces sp.]
VRKTPDRRGHTPGNTRRTLADAFATITPAPVRPGVTYPEPRVLRRALYSWAFNTKAWLREQANRLIEQSMQEWDRVSQGAESEG